MRSVPTLFVLLSVLVLAACGGSGNGGGGGGDAGGGNAAQKRVVVIPKGTTHVFWQAVRQGALAAGDKAGLDVVFKGPMKEDDRSEQIRLVQQFVAEGVAGIALAPLDHTALAAPIRRAKKKGIPVVVFDSALDGEAGKDFDSFVATDNEAAGRLGGEALAKLLADAGKAKGKVVLLRYQVGSASTAERERGFLAAAEAAGLEVLVDNRHAGATIGDAKTAALNLAEQLKVADGVFCPCESVTNGMLLALSQLGLAGKVKFVGFDSAPPIVAALRDGTLDAVVVQDPRRMGMLAVEHLKTLVDGGSVAANVDTGSVLATKANMDDAEVAPLLR
ncbi:MAG: substrate-binding domain-containing protein [Planctomycetota bacterium]